MNASIRAQHKHESTMRVVRVNGQIKVKQSKTKDNIKMDDHLGSIHFVFFQFGRNILGILGKLPNFTVELEFRKKTQLYQCTTLPNHICDGLVPIQFWVCSFFQHSYSFDLTKDN